MTKTEGLSHRTLLSLIELHGILIISQHIFFLGGLELTIQTEKDQNKENCWKIQN